MAIQAKKEHTVLFIKELRYFVLKNTKNHYLLSPRLQVAKSCPRFT